MSDRSASQPTYRPSLVQGVVQVLVSVFAHHKPADKAIESLFRQNKRWGKRDRAFVAERSYDLVRWWNRMERLSGDDGNLRDPATLLRRWAAYEIWRHGSDPTDFLQQFFAEEDVAVPEPRAWKSQWGRLELTPWEEVAFPEWLHQRLRGEYGDETQAVLSALNDPAPVCLRVNTLKANREQVRDALQQDGIEVQEVPDLPNALVLRERANVFRTEAFHKGWLEVQDLASQRVGLLLDPRPGERVADVCAGAGGKSLHLAMLMENRGTLLALDVVPWKLKELRKRAKRAGVGNYLAKLVQSTKAFKRLQRSFDAVLIDSPCSGTGTIRRNPDKKWSLSESGIERLGRLQADILETYAPLVKPRGRLVYATCSLLQSENQERLHAFLAGHPEFELDSEPLLRRPDLHGEDGFYAQRLVRKR
ncbi:MAG: RsmB/NOP family class I SAM-dependent RNA methyltransferase [SAR324 cluster bacterium]|nr:RsmB/NOP family class I SAM-dependent RNA methyltransferase [SAR324 cluster bacterium]